MPLAPGDTAFLRKTITNADVRQFAALSLDTNPLHLDEEYPGAPASGSASATACCTPRC